MKLCYINPQSKQNAQLLLHVNTSNGGQVNKFSQNQYATLHMRKQNAIWLDKVETNQFASKIAFAYLLKSRQS